jgi:hypothetical protein
MSGEKLPVSRENEYRVFEIAIQAYPGISLKLFNVAYKSVSWILML